MSSETNQGFVISYLVCFDFANCNKNIQNVTSKVSHNFKYEIVFEAVLGIFDNVKQKRNFLYEVYFIKQSVSEIVLLLFKVRIQLELIFKFILIPQKKFPHFVLVYE